MSAWFRAKDRSAGTPATASGGGSGGASGGAPEAGAAARVLTGIIERGSRAQAPAVRAYVGRLRNKYPDASPAKIVTKLEKRYLATVVASGAAVGSTAAVPGVGTLAALSAVTGETAVFLEATAVFVLAVAEVHGIPLEERERRRALVLAVLVGDEGKGAVRDLLGRGRTSGAWISEGAATLPLPTVSQLNSRLLRYFVKRYTLKRGALAFGKALPVGVGAVVGGVGNRMMGKKIIGNARTAFGAAPPRWPAPLHLLPPLPESGTDST
ncbi:hypothetical protein [Mycolicibacterium thermoresistibile]|uniref:Uncharacterized protein n=1 Tax=Mycolicibacterium thermoresistibile TaxID=1797 RepID=A0A100XFR9_MYCTH|nr:hypothetical protein [Mycolicibacterium thermoresistibile]MCV7190379.1 hypothetical protein [Mycolicibacterium thermoresistibile]GAT15847.1 hypothetical protein RMCT_2817 [Mycolicibacterium thermoresistibile]SNW19510.1 membrane protein [Mycolicibacterium thermoresistibile]